MARVIHHAVRHAAALVGLLGLAGCGSPAYQPAAKDTKPAASMAVKAESDGLEVTVKALIVFDGPGSWKQHAYWDEYVVQFVNNGTAPVEIDSVLLGDVLDREIGSGADPWALEKAGRKHEKFLVSVGAPADAFGSAHRRQQSAANAAGAAGLVALYTVPVAMPALLYGGSIVAMAASPVILVNKLFVDPKAREQLLAEFKRRRLPLPLKLDAGAAVTGSIFFPLTPGPERLHVRARTGERQIVVTVALPDLDGLHFMYVPDKAVLKAAKPVWPAPFGPKRIPERTAPVAGAISPNGK